MSCSRLLCALLPLLASVALACHDVHIDYERGERGEIVLYDDLYSVSTVDDKHAVAVGYYGAAYFTEDGGETWTKGDTGTLRSLYNVSMGDAKHGWAIGQRGTVLRTEDGGRTWKRQPNLKEKEGAHLFAVTAIDKDRAFIVGEWGTRIYTENGGKTWRDQSFTIDENHSMFVWLSPKDQERVRNDQKVYEDVGLNDIFCLGPPSTKCWLVGEFGYIYYSEDSGQTWQVGGIAGSVEMDPIKVPYNTLRVPDAYKPTLTEFAAAVKDESHLNVALEATASPEEIREFAGGDDPEELFEILEARVQEVRTVLENAGVSTDRIRLRGQPPWDYEDYLEDDPEFLQRYLDSRVAPSGGMRVRVIQNPVLFTVRFQDDENGLIAGLGGVVLSSNDGGKTWDYQTMDRKQALFSVGATGQRAVAIGEKGLVRFSSDAGQSWSEPETDAFPNVFTYMRDVSFDPSGRVGFIVGQTGQILRSTDAGHRWDHVLIRPEG